MAKNARNSTTGTTTPTPPQVTPPPSNEAWVMKSLMDLTGSVNRLEAKIDELKDRVVEMKTEHSDLQSRFAKVEKTVIAATAVAALVIAVGGFVANKAIDFGLAMASTHATEQRSPPSAPSTE